MSIIQEALKKAQKTDVSPDPIIAALPIATGPENKVAGRKNPAFYATTLISVVVVFAIGYFASSHSHKKAPIIVKNKPVVIETVEKPELPVTNISWNEKPNIIEPVKNLFNQSGDLVLSGIMHLEDGPRAIINNSMVAAGDTVGEAMIVSITDNSVVLKKGNSEIVLNLK